MTFRTTKLYLAVLLLSSLFFSCVGNSDEPDDPVGPPEEEVGLTIDNLLGTWQSFYYTKEIKAPSNSPLNSSFYRFTDTDGFTITYNNNGKYTERNVFGDEVISGDYSVTRKNEKTSVKDDAIRYDFKSKFTGKDSVYVAWVPYVYSSYYTHVDMYQMAGTGGYILLVQDSRYYRHTGRAANFMLPGTTYKKNMIDIEDLYGTWSLTNLERVENGKLKPMTDKDKAALGTKYEFTTKNGKPYYYETLPNGKLNQNDVFTIVDDVVIMRGIDPDSETLEIIAFEYWIKSPLTEITFVTYERQRKGTNVLVEEEKRETFTRVK